MADRYLLDTSAVFAYTDQEEGCDQVEKLLYGAADGQSQVEICSVSLTELFYITMQGMGEDEAGELVALTKSWPISWAHLHEKELLLGGRLKALHRLSFADALIAAVAASRRATLVHKDPEFEVLAGELSLLSLPFKGRQG